MSNNVFVYGTLMNQQIRESLIGDVEIEEGQLKRYERINTQFGYPTIKKNDYMVTNGYILKNLTDEQMAALDRYEGYPNFYRREKVEVNGQECWVYIMNI